MQQIPLSQGQFAIVDDKDYPLLSDFKWSYRPERNGKQGYATRHGTANGKDRLCYMHREVMPAPEGYELIFLNHDKLDCRRENLRLVTKEEARQHHRVRSDSKSGVKGVRYNRDTRNWSACIYRRGQAYHIGTFSSVGEAAAAYEEYLLRENPDLHTAPETVSRPENGMKLSKRGRRKKVGKQVVENLSKSSRLPTEDLGQIAGDRFDRQQPKIARRKDFPGI